MTTTAKLTGNEIRKGMILDGRVIESARNGVGSSKVWTYLRFAEADERGSYDRRVRRNTVRIEVQIP